MILAVHRVQGQELTNLANVNAVAFRGTEDGFRKLIDALAGFGVVLTEAEQAKKEADEAKRAVDALLRILPVKGA